MRLGTRFGLFLLRLSRFFQASVPVFLNPSSLLELNQVHFQGQAHYWIEAAEQGLFEQEANLLEFLKIRFGKILCLGAGAGREVFALEKRGFEVTGVEQLPGLVELPTPTPRNTISSPD